MQCFPREFSEGWWMLILWESREVFQVLNMKCVMSVYLHTVWAWSGVSSLFSLMILLIFCQTNTGYTCACDMAEIEVNCSAKDASLSNQLPTSCCQSVFFFTCYIYFSSEEDL